MELTGYLILQKKKKIHKFHPKTMLGNKKKIQLIIF